MTSSRFAFHPARLTTHRFPIRALDRPRRVAQLTDLHFGYATPTRLIADAVALTNAARPDLVVLTGDFVGYGTQRLPDLERVLGALDAPCVAVLGNHDHWTDAPAVTASLGRAGAEVLVNAWTVIDGLCVVGVDDGVTRRARPDEAVLDRPPGPTIGLSHDPEIAPALWAHRVPLVLSGHTHAGQVRVGQLTDGLQRAMGRRYVRGMYTTDAGSVYVSAGVGAAVMPLRIGEAAHREVAVFDLVPT